MPSTQTFSRVPLTAQTSAVSLRMDCLLVGTYILPLVVLVAWSAGRSQHKECYFREGRCFKCGSRGHRAAECRSKGNPTQEGRQEKERRTFKNSSNKSVRATETATITEVKEDPPAPPPKEATKEQPMTVDTRVAKIKALFEGLSQEQHEQVYDALEKEGF